MNSHPLASCSALLLLLSAASLTSFAVEPLPTTHYFDEVGMRYLSLKPMAGSRGVEVGVRWAADPGSMSVWMGQGSRQENQVVFAAVVEEDQDRGAFFIAKGGESKMEVGFKPGQKMPQDPGILGVYRHVSDEKFLQLARKESQAADDRLAAALKNASRTWSTEDKSLAGDWKAKWPVLRERWMNIAYQAPEVATPKPNQPFATGKEQAGQEKDADYWLKLAQTTALGYSFMQQPSDAQSKSSSWDGDYNDGFGGGVNIRRSKDGKLRVSLSCTRVSEIQGMDLSGTIPAEAVKSKNGELTAEGVFIRQEVSEDAKEARITLRRKGSFLWVEMQAKPLPGRKAWLDGIYRWAPAAVE